MGAFRLIYRLPWMLLHVLLGLPPTLLSFLPFFKAIELSGRPLNVIMVTWWSGMTCRIFGLRRRIKGEFAPGPNWWSQTIFPGSISRFCTACR